MDNKSHTQALSRCYLRKGARVQLILFSGMLNQLQNWIMKELILLWVPIVPILSSYTMMTWFIMVGLVLSSFLCIMVFL